MMTISVFTGMDLNVGSWANMFCADFVLCLLINLGNIQVLLHLKKIYKICL